MRQNQNIIVYGFRFNHISLIAHLLSLCYNNKSLPIAIKEFSCDTQACPEMFHLRIEQQSANPIIPKKKCSHLVALEWVGLEQIIEDYAMKTCKIYLINSPKLPLDYYYQKSWLQIKTRECLKAFQKTLSLYSSVNIILKGLPPALTPEQKAICILALLIDTYNIFPIITNHDLVNAVIQFKLFDSKAVIDFIDRVICNRMPRT